MQSREPIETEVKFALPSESEWLRLLRVLGGARETVLQTNRFFDGADGELARARIALRVRREERQPRVGGERVDRPGDPAIPEAPRTLVTIKTGGSLEAGIHRRIEIEAAVPSSLDEIEADPDRLLALPVEPIRELRRRVPELEHLICLGGFQNERHLAEAPVDLKDGGSVGLLWELDRTVYGPDLTVYELEIELGETCLPAGVDPVRVVEAVQGRLDAIGIAYRPEPCSKFARFRARQDAPPRSGEGA